MKQIREAFDIKNKPGVFKTILLVILFSLLSSTITSLIYYFNNSFHISANEQELLETYRNINEKYYDEIDMDKVKEAGINAMMKYLNEEYSEVLTEENYESLNDKLVGKYKGIGVTLSFDGENALVIDVIDDTPAKKSGIKVGDIIKKIDNIVIDQSNINNLSEIVKDKDKLNIEVIRNNEILNKTIDVKMIIKPCISSSVIDIKDKKIGYMYIESFSSTADIQAKNHLKELESENIDSLIIDVRNNTGGYLEVAQEIISMFTNEGKVIYQLKDKKSTKKIYDKTKESRNYDIVILVNEISASASEVLALSLKESYGAIIVGTKTYGKGKVQQISNLKDNDALKITIANWLSPNGNSIDKIGITPGIEVKLSKEFLENPNSKNDNQLQKALEILTN